MYLKLQNLHLDHIFGGIETPGYVGGTGVV